MGLMDNAKQKMNELKDKAEDAKMKMDQKNQEHQHHDHGSMKDQAKDRLRDMRR